MPTLRLKPLPGFEPVERFLKALVPVLPAQNVYQAFRLDTSFRDGHVQESNNANPQVFATRCEALRPVFKDRPYARCVKIHIAGNASWSIGYEAVDPLMATISIDRLENIPGADPVAIADALAAQFTFLRPEEIAFGNLPAAEQNQLRAYERALSDLTAQTAKLGELAGGIAETQANYFRKRSEEMDEQLRSERESLRIAHEKKMKEVAAKEDELSDRVKQLDLQEHKTARRALAKTTRDAIEALKQTEGNPVGNIQEALIHTVSLMILLGGGWLITYLVDRIAFANSPLSTSVAATLPGGSAIGATAFIPLIGVTVLVGSTLFFYLRFLSLWAERNALYRRNKEKYAIDFNRADWLTELVFEYADQKKEFPPEVMARLSQGLFTDTSWDKRNLHPGEDIIEFVSRISKLKASKEGAEIEMQGVDGEKKKA